MQSRRKHTDKSTSTSTPIPNFNLFYISILTLRYCIVIHGIVLPIFLLKVLQAMSIEVRTVVPTAKAAAPTAKATASPKGKGKGKAKAKPKP
jgi:hypothetical protein